jgi:hypothetical protein
MSTVSVIRYRTKPDFAEENAALVLEVFAELASGDPAGLRSMSLRLEDAVSFLHIAIIESEVNPLGESAAFERFQSEIARRCEEGPTATDATVLGASSFAVSSPSP